jgi:hypothetical protein
MYSYLKSFLDSSYVSPSSGLNGFPIRSKLEESALTANVDTQSNLASASA